jgi:hypothetical protein
MAKKPDSIAQIEHSSRRSFIKAASGLTVAGILSQTASASGQDDDAIFEQSLELRQENNWSVSEWHSYLDEKGLEYYAGQTTAVDGSDSTLSQDKLDSTQSVFTYTYYDRSNYDSAELNWDHSAGDLDDFGEAPPDGATIAFSPDYYERTFEVEDWVYYGQNAGDPNGFDSKDPDRGAACEFKDGLIPQDNDGYFGVRIEPNTLYSQNDRFLEFDYTHTWFKGEITGVSLGVGGPGVTFSTETKQWDYEKSFTESDLRDGVTRDPGQLF